MLLQCERRNVVFFVFLVGLRWCDIVAASTGDNDCKCIDVFTMPVTINGVAVDGNAACPWRQTNGTCYSSSYGSSQCLRHDIGATPSCSSYDSADEAMKWCETPWCYVDPATCNRPFTTSTVFGDVMVAGEPLAYSYATCGYLNYYNLGNEELRNLGRTLRVSWAPIDSSTGYTKVASPAGETGVLDSSGTDTGQTGSVVRFLADLFQYHGVEWAFVPLSNESLAYSPSLVTNCIHEVAINRTDICFFDSWLLDFRLELTTMVELFEDTMKVMVRKQGSEQLSFVEMLKLPFAPFTAQLWVIIVAQYVLSSAAVFAMEGSYNDEDFPDPSPSGAAVQSIFKGCMAAFGGGLLLNPKTVPGKVVAVGLALSVMVFMSIYGAQVTTALVQSRLGGATGAISSLEDGLERGTAFCVYAFTEPFVKARWPHMNTVPVGTGGKVYELFDALHEGKCEASLITDNWWAAAQAGVYSAPREGSAVSEEVYAEHMKGEAADGWKRYHCDDKLFPLPSMEVAWSIGNGVPVREELARPLRWAVKRAQDDPARSYDNYADTYTTKFVTPAAGCSEATTTAAGGEDEAATVQDGVGATMVSLFSTAAAAVIFWVIKCSERRAACKVTEEVGPVPVGGGPAVNLHTFSGQASFKLSEPIRAALAKDERQRNTALEEYGRKVEEMKATLEAMAASMNLNLPVERSLKVPANLKAPVTVVDSESHPPAEVPPFALPEQADSVREYEQP